MRVAYEKEEPSLNNANEQKIGNALISKIFIYAILCSFLFVLFL